MWFNNRNEIIYSVEILTFYLPYKGNKHICILVFLYCNILVYLNGWGKSDILLMKSKSGYQKRASSFEGFSYIISQ